MVGRSVLQPDPLLAAVGREEEAELRADEEQIGILVILSDGEHRSLAGKSAAIDVQVRP